MNIHCLQLSLLFLLSIPVYSFCKKAQGPVLVSEKMTFIDKMGTVKIGPVLDFGKSLRIFQLGENYKNKAEPVGLIPFGDRYITLKQASIIEQEALQNNDHHMQKQLEIALEKAFLILEGFSAKYFDTLENKKGEIEEIVDLWIVVTGRRESSLKKWASSRNVIISEFLRQNIGNFQELLLFCGDLSNFLAAFIQSLPITYQKHMDSRKAA
ncbi:MAG TPA: hypothetical protein VHA52_01715 [Candidatus Babeliaceae bacterium]|nr:hypothetical protein [Candidatus Babeliaceae bacterium]